MITVACVEVGNYLGRGAEYVSKLRSMVGRNLGKHKFVCLSDRQHSGIETIPTPNLGWWSKVHLFRPGIFTGRVLYIDLDSVITGRLDDYAKGIIHLRDWGWDHDMYGSGVMCWDAGEHSEIFTRFDGEVPKRHSGDQDWIFELGGWEALPAAMQRSYRYVSVKEPQLGCSIVCMHGNPKPHEIKTGWVPGLWR